MNLNNPKVKRKVGALNGKIWAADDCWEAENEIIHAVEISEIFPESYENKSQTKMTGKQFVEKWQGVLNGADVNAILNSKGNIK
jgi:hypothetical protein